MGMLTGWEIIDSSKAEYLTVWKVAKKIHGRRQLGYFKIPHRKSYRHIGPLLANELVCNKLGHVLGLPVAKTFVTTINGRTGILSLAMPNRELMTWSRFVNQHKAPLMTIVNSERIYKTFVFDVWICNVDRSGKNIIVYQRGKKYDFYLIDHELALLGAIRYENKSWQSSYWENIMKYTHGYHPALLRYVGESNCLNPYVNEIQKLPIKTIHKIIDSIPAQLLSKRDKILMKRILLRRRRRLDQIISHVS